MPRLAFQVDEDHPAGLVRLGERRFGIACPQGVVERLKQRFEAFQAAGHGPRRHVQTEQPPLGKQPLRGPVAGELVEQDLHPHGDAQQSLGDQLGSRRSGDGSRAVRAGACPLVTSPPDPAAIRADLDLDLFGILGVAGRQRRAAPRANALLFGQLAEFLDDRQVAVVPPCRTGPILPLAPLGRRGRCRILFAFETIGTVLGRCPFALSTEELILELAVLAAKLLDLGFEQLGPMHGPGVHRLPVPDLLPQFGVLAPQFVDFLAQFEDFATELPHQFGQISRLGGREWVDKRAVHNKNACNPKPILDLRAARPEKTGWAKLYHSRRAHVLLLGTYNPFPAVPGHPLAALAGPATLALNQVIAGRAAAFSARLLRRHPYAVRGI